MLTFFVVASFAFIGYGIFKYRAITRNLAETNLALASTTNTLLEKEQKIIVMQGENATLLAKLTEESTRNNLFNEQIQSISSTVGVLDKLSKTDKELLQKYSNVYFLNENYVPSSLADIDPAYISNKSKQEQIHTNIKPYLERLLADANSQDIHLLILSSYRSFGTQAGLKTSYKITYGTTAANRFSADQGYSEHQLGSTVDFTTSETGDSLSSFEKTSAYTWLSQNAHKYGFILSYAKGNKFFQYEPWHWRFVGVDLATKLHDENKQFYDMDQRILNTYLIQIF